MGKLAQYLNQLIVGNVFDSPEILEAYSTDRSALKIKPRAVAFPESTDDLQKLVKFANQLATKDIRIPISLRGSGLTEMGGDLGNGLVVSTEKLNHLLESDRRERLVRVQAGITLKELNTALSVNGLMIPIGGHDQETIGGLISSCPIDEYFGRYGGIMRYVERMEVVLSNGETIQTSRLSKSGVSRVSRSKTFEGDVYKKLSKLNLKLGDFAGRQGYPNVQKISHRGSMDLLPLFFGSEGTLGIISEVILRAIPIERETGRVAAAFADLSTAQKFLDLLKPLKPYKLDLYDLKMIDAVEETGKRVYEITKNLESGFVLLAKFNGSSRSYTRKITSVSKVLPKNSRVLIDANHSMAAIDELENSLSNYLNNTKGGERMPLLTDFYIPAEKLQSFVQDIAVLEEKLGMELSLHGSYLNNCYSLRPKFDTQAEDFNKNATAFLRTGSYIIERQEGQLVAGGPEGRIKSIITIPGLPDDRRAVYEKIKDIMDPNNILSPDIKLGTDARFTLRHFRSSASSKIMI